MTLVVVVVAVVVLIATYLTWLASRLDRLAVRVEAADAALDAQLVRRAMAAHELSHDQNLPALHLASRVALEAPDADREAAESALSRALREALPDGLSGTGELEVAARKVALARQFRNDAVRDLLALRQRRLVRLLHLYGGAKAPAYVEFDPGPPSA